MKTLLLSLALLSTLVLGACNTFHGVGRDMKAAGNWITGHSNTDHHVDVDVERHEYRATEY